MTIGLDDWQEVLKTDYLQSFIRDGGSAVKFVVTRQPASLISRALGALAAEAGYCAAQVSAADVRLDRIDKLFHAVAAQIDWAALAHDVRLRGLSELGFELPEPGVPVTYESLAEVKGVATQFVRDDVQKWLTQEVFRDLQLTQDFRKAMLWYCEDPLRSALYSAETERNVNEWLTGDLRLLSAVRPQQIFQKIARHNARDMLASLGRWVRIAGKPGLVVVCDISAAVSGVMPAETETRKYTRAALVDLYEAFRQCVDSTDELKSILLVVIAGPEFVEDDRRGVETYRALYLRTVEEVRDRARDNPLATLVRIE